MVDRRFRLPRIWSNQELSRLGPCFQGDIVNVSAWEDRDKQGRHYRDYFCNAKSYSYTNFGGYRGLQGVDNEYSLDLTGDVPSELTRRFDVVFNHTTLEHIFDVRRAFANLCVLSRDAVIVVVPFAQVMHESDDWKDYWRFTPSCMRALYRENGLGVIYEAQSPHKNSGIYLLMVGSRQPDQWTGRLPSYQSLDACGEWIGAHLGRRLVDRAKNAVRRLRT